MALRAFFQAHPHLRIAIIIAPLLALGGYILADRFLAPADMDSSVQPVQFQPCDLLSGQICRILRRDIAINLILSKEYLYLSSSVPLRGALLGIDEQDPHSFHPRRNDGQAWLIQLKQPIPQTARLKFVFATLRKMYYAEWTENGN